MRARACKYLLSAGVMLALHFFAIAQKEADNWLFGTIHLNFSSGSPQLMPPIQALTVAGASSMSDQNGNLLYFSDGYYVYNRLKQRMPAVANNPLFGPEIFQGAGVITFPMPGNDSLYYLFYVAGDKATPQVNYGLFYCIINMKADNSLGDVVVRDVRLFPNMLFTQKLTAALHCNKKDVWLTGHLRNSDKYFSLLITENGISTSQVLSTGQFIDGFNPINSLGYMKISASGDKVAAAFEGQYDFVELGNFNNQTGAITDLKVLRMRPSYAVTTPANRGPYGIEFSPSGHYLYVTSLYTVTWGCCDYPTGHLHQFDATLPDATAVQSSMIFLDSMSNENYWAMQLANNGKIYFNAEESMHAINNPEGQGLSCGYQRSAITNGGIGITSNELPVFMQSYFRYPIVTTGNCQNQNVSFSVQNTIGITSVAWDFDDPASGINNTSTSFTPTHFFSQPGAYRVRLILQNTNACGEDTVYKTIHAGILNISLGNDTAICSGDTAVLKMKIPNASNLWSTGSMDTVLRVTQPGKYWIRVSLGECQATDTIQVTRYDLPVFTLGDDTTICTNQSVLLAPLPDHPGSQYQWSTGAATNQINVNQAGVYSLRIQDINGCHYKDSMEVTFSSLPSFTLGIDTSLCENQPLLLSANVPNATFLWSTGNNSNQQTITASGIYWLDATLQGCIYRDSIEVTFKPVPQLILGGDTTLCLPASLVLNAGNPGSLFLWQDGSTSQTFTVQSAGKYFVRVNSNGCFASDTILVDTQSKPVFSLGADRMYCPAIPVILRPSSLTGSTVWSDGSTGSELIVKGPGVYYLDISNECGQTRDSVNIIPGYCKLVVPNAFSPNDDNTNDVFRVKNGEGLAYFELRIFNRWGQQVFISRRPSDGWDGKINGTKATAGAYVWILSYKQQSSSNTEILKGTLLLLR